MHSLFQVNTGLLTSVIDGHNAGLKGFEDIEVALAVPVAHEIGHAIARHAATKVALMPLQMFSGALLWMINEFFVEM